MTIRSRGAGEKGGREGDAEGSGGPMVDPQHEPGRLLDRKGQRPLPGAPIDDVIGNDLSVETE